MARVTFEGYALDARTRDMLIDARIACPAPMFITQGSYSTGVSASAGTHSGGGAVDIRARDLTTQQRSQVVAFMRRVGFAAWLRTPAQADWPYHVHAIAIGCPDLSSAAARQVTAYKNGRNGLASNGLDDGPRDWVNVTWETYLTARGGLSMADAQDILNKLAAMSTQLNTLAAKVDNVDEAVWNKQIADPYTPESGDTKSASTLLTWTAPRVVNVLAPQLAVHDAKELGRYQRMEAIHAEEMGAINAVDADVDALAAAEAEDHPKA